MSSVVLSDNLVVNVPKPIYTCFNYLVENSSSAHGIFRVNGSVKRVNSLILQLKRNPSTDLSKINSGFTIYDVATVLKKLLSYYLKDTNCVFVNNSGQLSKIQQVCKQEGITSIELVRKTFPLLDIPTQEFHILLYLTSCLNEISKYVEVTEMPVSNLAIVFQPHFFNSESIVEISDLKTFKNAIEGYILHTEVLQELYKKRTEDIPQRKVKVRAITVKVPATVEILAIEGEKKSFFMRRALSIKVKKLIS